MDLVQLYTPRQKSKGVKDLYPKSLITQYAPISVYVHSIFCFYYIHLHTKFLNDEEKFFFSSKQTISL